MWSLPWREALAKRSPDHGTHGINSEFLLPIRKKVAEGRMRVEHHFHEKRTPFRTHRFHPHTALSGEGIHANPSYKKLRALRG